MSDAGSNSEIHTGYKSMYYPGPDECENLEGYQVGGFHPVEIGDNYGAEDKYTIVHKLGAGNGATVWLAQVTDSELSRYVAIKILTADASEPDSNEVMLQTHLKNQVAAGFQLDRISLLLDTFSIEGPNGTHLCLVYEPAGPSLAALHRNRQKVEIDVMQDLALQTAQGLKQLHDAGVVYGDLGANNILLRVVDINSWTVDELYQRLGHPEPYPVVAAIGHTVDDHAPKFVYEGIAFTEHPDYLKPEISFIDLADGRLIDDLSRDRASGWSLQYTAPETLWFQDMQDEASDIWALACVWFELRSAEKLFEAAYEGTRGIQYNIIDTIGGVPDSWVERIRLIYQSPEEDSEDIPQDNPEEVPIDDPEVPAAEQSSETNSDEYADEPFVQHPHQEMRTSSIRTFKVRLRNAWIWLWTLFRTPKTLYDPESPTFELESDYPHDMAQLYDPESAPILNGIRPNDTEMDDGEHEPRIQDQMGYERDEVQAQDPEPAQDHDGLQRPDVEMDGDQDYVPADEYDQPDESLRARIARIGDWHEWFHLSLEKRVARKKAYSEEYADITTADVDSIPPPLPLTKEEQVDFEDLLSSILTYEMSERMPLEEVLVHPYFTKQYREPSTGAWLKEYDNHWAPPKEYFFD